MKSKTCAVSRATYFAASLLASLTFFASAESEPWSGAGSEENPYEIATAADLKALANTVNAGEAYAGQFFKLSKNIDLTDVDWTPIGNGTRKSYEGKVFKGVFNGNGKEIQNLTISTDAGADYAVGLFGVVEGGTISNLTLTAVSLTATSCECAGAVAGFMTGGVTVEKVTVNGTVNASQAGGLVGRLTYNGTIRDSVNNATVTGTTDGVGGIVSKAYCTRENEEINLINCVNNGAVSGKSYVGGIAGLCSGNITTCRNTAVVSSTGGSTGGIVGEQKSYGTVSGCVNEASVTGDGNFGVGGIVGWIRYQFDDSYLRRGVVSVTSCTNLGAIANGKSGAGGIVGHIYNAATITSNVNKASTISAEQFVGGLVGGLQESTDNGYYHEAGAIRINGNTSTTTAENLTGACKDLYAYNNDNSRVYFPEVTVATVGDRQYISLKHAVTFAEAGDTVTLHKNVNLTATGDRIWIEKPMTVDLNGFTVSTTVPQLININCASGKPKIINGTITSSDQFAVYAFTSGSIEGCTISTTASYAVRANAGVDLDITNCTVTAGPMCAVYAYPNSNVKLTDSTISASFYAVYARGALEITHCGISASSESAVYAVGNTVIADSSITSPALAIFSVADDLRLERTTVETTNPRVGNKPEAIYLGEGAGKVTLDAASVVTTEGYAVVLGYSGSSADVSGKINAACGVVTNGSDSNNTIYVREGAEIRCSGVGLYLPAGDSHTYVEGGLIEGSSGIEIRAGELVVTGGTIRGTGTPSDTQSNSSGTTTIGAGIAIAQHTTQLPLSVKVSGGTVEGFHAVQEHNPQGNDSEALSKVSLEIKDGTFNAINEGTSVINSEDLNQFISGGTFNQPLSDAHCAEGFMPTSQVVDGQTVYGVDGPYEARIGTTGYATLAAANAAAQSGDTVTLLLNEYDITLGFGEDYQFVFKSGVTYVGLVENKKPATTFNTALANSGTYIIEDGAVIRNISFNVKQVGANRQVFGAYHAFTMDNCEVILDENLSTMCYVFDMATNESAVTITNCAFIDNTTTDEPTWVVGFNYATRYTTTEKFTFTGNTVTGRWGNGVIELLAGSYEVNNNAVAITGAADTVFSIAVTPNIPWREVYDSAFKNNAVHAPEGCVALRYIPIDGNNGSDAPSSCYLEPNIVPDIDKLTVEGGALRFDVCLERTHNCRASMNLYSDVEPFGEGAAYSCSIQTAKGFNSVPLPTASVEGITKTCTFDPETAECWGTWDGGLKPLTFAMEFSCDDPSAAQSGKYGNWVADFVLTCNKNIRGVDGYLAGYYGTWGWIALADSTSTDVMVKAGEPFKIMSLLGDFLGGWVIDYNFVLDLVQTFDCGLYLTPEFLNDNPDFEVKLELRLYDPEKLNNPEDYPDYEGELIQSGDGVDCSFLFKQKDVLNWYTVKNTTTGEYYETLAGALAAAEAGNTVKLLADLNTSETVAVDKNITLDLNGTTVTTTADPVFTAAADTTLVIEDNSAGCGGVLSGEGAVFAEGAVSLKAGVFNSDVSAYCARGYKTTKRELTEDWLVVADDFEVLQLTVTAGVAVPIAMPFGTDTENWQRVIDTSTLTRGVDGTVATTVKVPSQSGYACYYLNTSGDWTLYSGESFATSHHQISTGDAIWITNPNATTVTLKGQLSETEPEVAIQPGVNMVSFPVVNDVDLNTGVSWTETLQTTPTQYDSIETVQPGTGTTCVWHYIDGRWVNTSAKPGTDAATAPKKIVKGQGFAYIHGGSGMILPKGRRAAAAGAGEQQGE